jgi:hypothetical protein
LSEFINNRELAETNKAAAEMRLPKSRSWSEETDRLALRTADQERTGLASIDINLHFNQ